MESSNRVPAILSFVQAAERGSFAAAARFLGISAAAVSKNVAGLERALDVRLMNRTTRSLQLTAEGLAFFERARVAIDVLDQAFDTVAAQRAEPVGKIRLSTSNAFGKNYIMPLLPELMQRYPALSFEVDYDDRRIDLVKEGYDLALRGGILEDSSLVSRSICSLHTILVASPPYLQNHGIPKTREDLVAHRKIAVRFLSGQISRWGFKDENGLVEEYEPEAPVLTVSAPEAAVEAAVLGLGIAQVGVHHSWADLQAGRLKIVLANEHHTGGREMALHYPHRAFLAPRIRVTVDFLLEKLAQVEALHVPFSALTEFAV